MGMGPQVLYKEAQRAELWASPLRDFFGGEKEKDESWEKMEISS